MRQHTTDKGVVSSRALPITWGVGNMPIASDGDDLDGIAPKSRPESEGIEVVEDDPETVWGLWDSATEEHESRFGEMHPSEFDSVMVRDRNTDALGAGGSTTPSEENDVDRKVVNAFLVVARRHPDIAGAVRSLWGTDDCVGHINKFIVDGIYQNGGLAMEAAEALIELADLHYAKFRAHASGLDLDLG
jgi:hypothetical protein